MAKLGTTEETNRLLGGNYFDVKTGKQIAPVTSAALEANTASYTPITPEVLTSTETPLTPPTPKVSTTAESLGAFAGSVGESAESELGFLEEQLKKAEEARKVEQNAATERQGLISKALGVKESRSQLEAEEGVSELCRAYGEARKAIIPAQNALMASQKAQQAEIKALEGVGLTDVQKAANIREINRKYALEQADLSFNLLTSRQLLEGARVDLETAQNLVDRKIELELEPIQFVLDNTKEFYERYQDRLDKEDQRLFEARIGYLEQERDAKRELAQEKSKLALEFLKQGKSIPSYYQKELNSAKNLEEVSKVVQNMARDGISLESVEGSESTASNFLDIMQDEINNGASPEAAARTAAQVSELQGIQVDQKTLTSWVKTARTLKKQEIIEAPEPVEPRKKSFKESVVGSFFSKLFGG